MYLLFHVGVNFFLQVRVADKVPPALAWLNQKHKVRFNLSDAYWVKNEFYSQKLTVDNSMLV